MQAIILAGGFGSRISEETGVRPKPLIEVGGRPVLWHILKHYSGHGISDFIICLGYKGYMIKEYFANYALHMSDVTLELHTGRMQVHQNLAENWRVTLVDTGESTMTGGRIKRIAPYLAGEEFCCTYGDGLGDVNIAALIDFHRRQGTLATLTAALPPGRFGALVEASGRVTAFREKPPGDGGWVNAGFFVLSRRVLDYIAGDETVFEREPLERLAHEGQLASFRHTGFWHPMDTLRDRTQLEQLWASGAAPWKTWP